MTHSVTRVGAALLVHDPAGPSRPGLDLAGRAPAEPGRTPVFLDPALAVGAAAAVRALPPAAGSRLRLMIAAAGSGRPAPAQWLADRDGADVIAAHGGLVALHGGGWFAARTWLRFRPGAEPEPAGARHPAPGWEPDLPAGPLRSPDGLLAEPIPAGLWVHRPAGGGRPDDVAFLAPPDPVRIAVVVGGPGEPEPADREVADLLAALSPAVGPRLVRLRHDRLRYDWRPDAEPVRPVPGGIVLAPARIAPWWRPDPRLYAVIARYDAATASFALGAGTLEPDALGDLVAARPDWDRRPVLLAAPDPPAGWIAQRIADRLRVAVVGGPWRGQWAAVRPTRAGAASPPRGLGASYPFTDGALERARAGDDDAVLDRPQRAAATLVHSGQSTAPAGAGRYRGPVGLDESGHPFAPT